jgi:integrase
VPRIHLTHRTLRALETEKSQETFWDDSLHGFGVRVSGTSSRKSFILRYRGRNGKRPRLTIGTYPAISLADARDTARELLVEAARGNDPADARKKHRTGDTFADLAQLYLERHAKVKKRSWREDERKLDKDLLPRWGSWKAVDVKRADVLEMLDEIVDRGAPITANRTLALVSKIYNFGMARGIIEANPAALVPPPGKEESRQRVLTEEEICVLWQAFDTESLLTAATFKLRLLTAQRGIEVLSMRWEDLDGDWWEIPAEVAKNGLVHRIPLSPQALEVLDSIRPLSEGKWIFPSPTGHGHMHYIHKAVERLRGATNIDWNPHDLRRTAATYMTRLGAQRLTVSKILNHADESVTAVYDRNAYQPEKRQALTAWANRVEQIVTGKSAKKQVVGHIGVGIT